MDKVICRILEDRPGFVLFEVLNRKVLYRGFDKDVVAAYATELGVQVVPTFYGYHDDETLPVKQGDTVIIPKGTPIRSLYPNKPSPYLAGKTYKIRVYSLMPGSIDWNNTTGEKIPMTDPQVCWPGAGYYWCDDNINDILILED